MIINEEPGRRLNVDAGGSVSSPAVGGCGLGMTITNCPMKWRPMSSFSALVQLAIHAGASIEGCVADHVVEPIRYRRELAD